MQYYLKENFRFLYADGQIYDENNQVVYEFENVTLLFPQINVYKYGQQIGYIKKQFTWFLNKYEIFHYNKYIDTIKQQFKFFASELHLDYLGWTIKGDFLSWNYEIFNQHNEVIARVKQELFRLTQRFYIDIYDEDNEDIIMLVILGINQFDKDKENSAAASASSHR